MSTEEEIVGQEMAVINVADIRPGDNDRQHFDDEELAQLARSILELGQITPVLVRHTPGADTEYQLIGGERRWRAHRLAGITTIKAVIDRSMSDEQAAAAMTAENTGRVDLDPMEEARAYAKLAEQGMTNEQIADACGVAKFRVDWRLDLLTLCPSAQEAIRCGAMPPGPALELRRLTDPNVQANAVKAWLANPTMGHLPFKRKCIEWAERALDIKMEGLFALDEVAMVSEVLVIKPKTGSVPTLRKMIGRLATALEAAAASSTEEAQLAYLLLIEEARDMI